MARFQKPAEGTWTEHDRELVTGPVSFDDSISPVFSGREREAIFKRPRLCVGRAPTRNPREGLPHAYAFKEYSREDCGTLDGTRMALEQGASRDSLRTDQEILLRHFRRTVGSVDAYVCEHAAAR